MNRKSIRSFLEEKASFDKTNIKLTISTHKARERDSQGLPVSYVFVPEGASCEVIASGYTSQEAYKDYLVPARKIIEEALKSKDLEFKINQVGDSFVIDMNKKRIDPSKISYETITMQSDMKAMSRYVSRSVNGDSNYGTMENEKDHQIEIGYIKTSSLYPNRETVQLNLIYDNRAQKIEFQFPMEEYRKNKSDFIQHAVTRLLTKAIKDVNLICKIDKDPKFTNNEIIGSLAVLRKLT